MPLCAGNTYPGHTILWIYDDALRVFNVAQTHCLVGDRFDHLRRLRQETQQTRKETRIDGKTKRINGGIG